MQSTYGTLPTPPRLRTSGRGPAHTPIQRSPADFAVLLAGVVTLFLVALILGWQIWHVNRIYTGVRIADVPVGGLTRAGAINRLQQNSPHAALPAVSLTLGDRQWPLQGSTHWASPDWTHAVNDAYLTGRRATLGEQLRAQARAAVGDAHIDPPVTYHTGQLRYLVSQIATELHRPAQGARRISDVQIPAQAGVVVDEEATVQNLLAALARSDSNAVITVPLVTATLAPPTGSAASRNHADASLPTDNPGPSATSFQLRNDQFRVQFALDPVTWREMVLSQQPPRLDEEQLVAVLEKWAQQIHIPARDARLSFDPATQAVSVVQESLPGRKLDIDATLTAVRNAVARGEQSSELVIESVPPAVDSSRLGELGIRELIASSTTYFAGSSAARVHNIEVAAEQFESVVIPPGGIFSFNELVGDVTSANGFIDSLIIWGDRTAVGIGGGVCQVSTTVFRAAYAAGFPIVERYNHGYVVDWYGEPGLDATIYTPTVDFRFRNDSGAHLLIDPVVDAAQGTMTFNLYGTKPEREVMIGDPVVSDVVEPASPEYKVDESLAPGQQQQVEWEQQGMTVTVQRTIIEDGETRTDTLTSTYQPWRAVYLVGPETEAANVPAESTGTS